MTHVTAQNAIGGVGPHIYRTLRTLQLVMYLITKPRQSVTYALSVSFLFP